ncbi:MAG: MoaD/ThiS family protein [Thiothrix sp.]|nr:MoaD/ThiS family protein [Thiothrix sp.]HPE58847.1 MoaD/ThiS family protein [Thiolinea sp.]
MKITLKLYATLSDLLPPQARDNRIEIEVDATVRVADILARFQIPPPLAHLVLLNGVFLDADKRGQPGLIQAGDVLAVWPPVAGG